MKIINAGYEILTPLRGIEEVQFIEKVARTCYKSEDKITEDGSSARKMVGGLIRSGHEAMLEHGGMTVRFTVDRGISHEIVRHRMASFAQESTRYCNYSKDKFGKEITVILPNVFHDISEERRFQLMHNARWDEYSSKDEHERAFEEWFCGCSAAEKSYFLMLERGCAPQIARDVLPTSTKTELIMTANWREWRHVFGLRCAPDAHPQIREVMIPLLCEVNEKVPVLFEDIFETVYQQRAGAEADGGAAKTVLMPAT